MMYDFSSSSSSTENSREQTPIIYRSNYGFYKDKNKQTKKGKRQNRFFTQLLVFCLYFFLIYLVLPLRLFMSLIAALDALLLYKIIYNQNTNKDYQLNSFICPFFYIWLIKLKTNFSTTSIMVHFQILLILYLTTCKYKNRLLEQIIINVLLSFLIIFSFNCGLTMLIFYISYLVYNHEIKKILITLVLPILSALYVLTFSTNGYEKPLYDPSFIVYLKFSFIPLIYRVINDIIRKKPKNKDYNESIYMEIVFIVTTTFFPVTEYGIFHLFFLIWIFTNLSFFLIILISILYKIFI